MVFLALAGFTRLDAVTPDIHGPYVLLHTLSHLMVQALAMRCGYPASSIRERIYAEETPDGPRYGILLYTGTPDAEGTLGGLVQQGRHIESHLGRRPARRRPLLERPHLRPARPGRNRDPVGRPPAPRRRLPRLLPDRRNLVRNAQRLLGPRIGGAGARLGGRGVLRVAGVTAAKKLANRP